MVGFAGEDGATHSRRGVSIQHYAKEPGRQNGSHAMRRQGRFEPSPKGPIVEDHFYRDPKRIAPGGR